jgi:hypothetical protein
MVAVYQIGTGKEMKKCKAENERAFCQMLVARRGHE